MKIHKFKDFDKFFERAKKMGIESNLNRLKTTHGFSEITDGYMITSFKSHALQRNIVTIVKKDTMLVYPDFEFSIAKIKPRWKTLYWKSSLTFYSLLRYLVDKYTKYFEEMNVKVDQLSVRVNKEPAETLESVEHLTLELRRFIDSLEDLLKIIIKVEEKGIKFVNVRAIGYEYKVLIAEARLLWDRSRSARKELNILMHKCNTLEAHELNDSFVKLTKIAAILAIVAIVISVPNTVATIFGIPTLAVLVNPVDVVWLMIISTIISVMVCWWYLRRYL